MSLIARHLEANGIPTVILGSALDVVEHCGVPRFAFVDFPLGNPCGRPWDRTMQMAIVTTAVGLFEGAEAPRTTLGMAHRWSEDEGWRDEYLAVRDDDLEALRRKGEERRALRAQLRTEGRVRQG
ncbi:MAG: hypothetical protein OXS50_06535 [Gammaproteobacteria bacterium]|nr:hypothetical protein [Gammaproteobacteria bacterium]